jgi:polysaccharide deacetylase family protein (PEP-CTERM system associated)
MCETLNFGPPVITVDVEDWPQSTWERSLPITPRAASNTCRVLDIMQACGVRATFFVLGKFAETFPQIVREIAAAGHEIASHGHGHEEIFTQSREEFRRDIVRSRDYLEQLIGQQVLGYRAPDFSIVRRSLWALEELAGAGFQYDSSIFPIRKRRYGIPEWPVVPVRIQLPSNRRITEFPIATYPFRKTNLPVGGGGYFRLLPKFVSLRLVRRVLTVQPFVFYCHPYEFDPREFGEITVKVPLKVRLHQGMGRRWFGERFKALVRAFGGQRMKDLLSTFPAPDLSIEQLPSEPVRDWGRRGAAAVAAVRGAREREAARWSTL